MCKRIPCFDSMEELKAANKASGHHFFDADTMQFFNSKIIGGLELGRYFVTSEKGPHQNGPLYTVREASEDGSIKTAGKFQQFKTAREAREAIRRRKV